MDKKPFTIVMPPPNVTGQLHMGHALDETMQDILIRFKRMQGYEALWQPGTDHAAIATEVKVTEKLKKEGIDKAEIGREKFLEYAWEWKEEYGGKIINQLKKLGASLMQRLSMRIRTDFSGTSIIRLLEKKENSWKLQQHVRKHFLEILQLQ